MKRQDEEEGKERGGRRKERCKEGEHNDEEQGGVNSKKINRFIIFIHFYTVTDQKSITPSRFQRKGWSLKAVISFQWWPFLTTMQLYLKNSRANVQTVVVSGVI